eukprot:g18604.t1
MNGTADEFCVVEPLTMVDDELVQHPGAPRVIEGIAFEAAPLPPAAPDTPAPPPAADTPKHDNTSSSSCSPAPPSAAVPSVLADDELWGPPPGARRPYQARRSRGGGAGGGAKRATATISPPWTGTNEFGGDDGAGAITGRGRMESAGELAGAAGPAGERGVAGGIAGVGAGPAGARSTPTPRRKRSSTSGINRERQFDGTVTGGTGSGRFGGGGGGGGGGRRRSGPGNGRGGLSKKTLNIVTNLKSHSTDVRSREEMEDLEEEKKLAEEERRFKENLRQKGDDFDHTIRILLLGDSGVGKTSLMTRFSEDKFAPTMISTAGVDFKVQTLDIHGKRVKCQIWDTAGQERFHVITRAYYRGAHGIALTYDVTDDDSFKNVNYWMANIQTHADRGHRMQKMILGNKVDIEERTISTKDGQDVAKEFGVRFFEVSAKNGYGVSDAFYTLAVDIVQAMEAANKRGNDERRAARLFGGGAARLRSFASAKKPAFLSGRKISGVSWISGSGGGGGSGSGRAASPEAGAANGSANGASTGTGNGKGNGKDGGNGGGNGGGKGDGAGAGAETVEGAGAEAESGGAGVAGAGAGMGEGEGATSIAKSASDRCKVS